MNPIPVQPTAPARIEYLKVQNFRALQSVEFKNLTPLTVLLGPNGSGKRRHHGIASAISALTVLLGPNGSGKSTVFDVFAFLAECFETGLRKVEAARAVAAHINPSCNRSHSFVQFRDAIIEANILP